MLVLIYLVALRDNVYSVVCLPNNQFIAYNSGFSISIE